jgi:hypothetical protein
MSKKLPKLLFLLFGCTWLVTFIVVTAVGAYLLHTRPEFPQPSLGRVYPLSMHGWVVYVTEVESVLGGRIMFNISFFAGFASLLVLKVFKPFDFRRRNGQER